MELFEYLKNEVMKKRLKYFEKLWKRIVAFTKRQNNNWTCLSIIQQLINGKEHINIQDKLDCWRGELNQNKDSLSINTIMSLQVEVFILFWIFKWII